MLSETEARQRILERSPRGPEVRVPLPESLGRRTTRPLLATCDLPGFDNSSMDGYAVRAAEAVRGARLRLAGVQPAGPDQGLCLAPGEAIRIFTGAPLPAGADAVVMQEDTRAEGTHVTLLEDSAIGEFVRRRGADLCVGQILFSPGDRIRAAGLGLLASQGMDTVPVVETPRVAIVTTGDELQSAGTGIPLGPGQIHDSNGPLLAAVARHFGAVSTCHHAPDEPARLRVILEQAMDEADFVWIAGGVSVGDRDFVRPCLEELGCVSEFWRVRIKPGKPFLFARREDGPLIFGLPGNPVSAFVTALLFAVPALEHWNLGDPSPDSPPLQRFKSRLLTALTNPGDRPHYLRAWHDSAEGTLRPAGLQESHALAGLSRANALIRLEAGATGEAGSEITAFALDF
ncbi:MAG: gephyrin-like molybdotransferase Glp [Verrucomicrobiales bacterium]